MGIAPLASCSPLEGHLCCFQLKLIMNESWTIKKTECWRTDDFELWCWRRLLRVPGTAKRSNQSILKEINPKYSLEGLMLRLKRQYIGHLVRRANSLEKTLLLEKIEGKRGRGQQRMRWLVGWHHQLNGHEFGQTPRDSEGQGSLMCFGPQGAKSQTQLGNWTTTTKAAVTIHMQVFVWRSVFIPLG